MSKSGGLGDGSGGARDTRLIEKAIRQRWAIPAELRDKLPRVLADVIGDPDSSNRDKIAASRAVLSADQLNLEQEKRDAGGDTLTVNVSGGLALTVEQAVAADRELEAWERERGLRADQPGDGPEVPK